MSRIDKETDYCYAINDLEKSKEQSVYLYSIYAGLRDESQRIKVMINYLNSILDNIYAMENQKAFNSISSSIEKVAFSAYNEKLQYIQKYDDNSFMLDETESKLESSETDENESHKKLCMVRRLI